MATVPFTEEPEQIQARLRADVLPAQSPTVPNNAAKEAGPTIPDLRWDESKWSQSILKQECTQKSRAELDQRVADFLALATEEEQAILSSSRDEFHATLKTAVDASKARGPGDPSAGPSVAERLKSGWSAANAVAYQYVQMLDVMVGQAPEYVGLAYGAVKILLVAQINHEEVKQKVKDYLGQIQLKFGIIDHLTAYMPTLQLVTLVAQAYSLFNRFVAKAIKHYTRTRPMRYLVAFTMPWKRFQDIVDSIEVKLSNIKEVAQYIGLAEGRAALVVGQQALALLQQNYQDSRETKMLVESMRVQLNAISIKFSREAGVRQTADSLAQLAEESLSEPTMQESEDREPAETAKESEVAVDFDSWQDKFFPELRHSNEAALRQERANEELPSMRHFRAERKNFDKSEKAMAWAKSRKSEILCIDGSQVLSREDFNASFVFPLMLVAESLLSSFVKAQHFCAAGSRGGSDAYLIMMQDVVAQVLRQLPSVSLRLMTTVSREATSTTEKLWDLLSKIISESEVQCVFLIIGGIDHIASNSSRPNETRTEVVQRLQTLSPDDQKVVKIIVTGSMAQPQNKSVEDMSSLIRARHPQSPRRRLTLDGLEGTLSSALMSQRLTASQERRCRDVQFTELPMLYTPGTVIYTQDDATLEAFIVSEMSGMEPRPFGSFAPLRLRVWSVDHDGKGTCKRYQDFVINHFPGRRLIVNLTYVPSGYLPDEVEKRKHIIERGHRYWSYNSGVHSVDIRSNRGSQHGIVDQSERPIESDFREQLETLSISGEALVKPRFLMLAPAKISVYVLRDMAWSFVAVESLLPMSFPPNALDMLVLAEDKKQLLLDAVRSSQEPRRSEMDDIIPTRKGLVVLLYGPPGVGMTSTAEMMAMATQKPLLSIGVADVGIAARHVEANLSKIFALATKWDAILLLDDADVFLENRGRGSHTNSADNNALVSVFLRVLEYYHGVLFLTTNHIANFDLAVVSRIHVAIRYESLEFEQTNAIFRILIRQLSDNNLVKDEESIVDWLEDNVYREGLDGRQIRNLVSTALGLARAGRAAGKGDGKLTTGHFKRAFYNVKDFKRDFIMQMQRYKDSQFKMIK